MSYHCGQCPPRDLCRRCRQRRQKSAARSYARRKVHAVLSLCLDNDPWLLAEDGITDPIAIEVAVRGQRAVRLTRREREKAAIEIILNGGSAVDVVKNLRLPVRLADGETWRVITTHPGARRTA